MKGRTHNSNNIVVNVIRLEGFFGPFILCNDLVFFFGSKVLLNVEQRSDLIRSLALHHGGYIGTAQFEQWINVQIVGSQDNLEQGLLVQLNESRIPLIGNHVLHASRLEWLLNFVRWAVLGMSAELDNFLQDCALDVG